MKLSKSVDQLPQIKIKVERPHINADIDHSISASYELNAFQAEQSQKIQKLKQITEGIRSKTIL